MVIPFDQYQRYYTISQVVNNLKEQWNISSFKILEIGANVQKNLEKFIVDDEIYYSDIELPQELQEDPQCFVADATNLMGIQDNSYDIVIASDVYEHIPPHKREAFISEINRVARYSAIICFPFLSQHNIEAEKRTNNYFMTIAGVEYIWLKEHLDNTLPSKSELEEIIKLHKLNYCEFEHGDINHWELLMKTHMYTSIVQDLIDYREQMDNYYNTSVYPSDVSNHNYRSFYIMFKDARNKTFINKAINKLDLIKSERKEIDPILLNFNREIKEINEIKIRLMINESMGKKTGDDISSYLTENEFSIYFDYGQGFTEEHKYTAINNANLEINHNSVKINIPENVLKVRIDPCEGEKCILFNLTLLVNGTSIKIDRTNALTSDKYYIFNTTDPWIEVDVNKGLGVLEICAEMILLRNLNLSLAIDELYQSVNMLVEKIDSSTMIGVETDKIVENKLKILSYGIEKLIYDTKYYQEENKTLFKEINSKKDEYDKLKIECDRIINEKEGLINEKDDLINEKEGLINERESLINEILKLKIETDAFEYKLENLLLMNEKLKHELSENSNKLSKLDQDNVYLYNEVQKFKSMYISVTSSFFWNLTKPFRVIVNVIKRLLKKNRITYKICRGIIICRQHGIRYCFNRVFRHRKKQELVSTSVNENLPPINETIKFSILVPIYNPECRFLEELIDSILMQNYQNWELCLADGSTENKEHIQKLCKEYSKKDSRIKYVTLIENKGISGNTNECAKMATGDYFVLSDQDDLLHPNALYFNAMTIEETNAEVLYSDEDHITEDGKQHLNVFYKPDWSIDLLYNQMYICHLFVFKRSIFEQVGGFRSEYDGSQDYDLMLRFSEITNHICHIPRVLYSWRETSTSTASNADAKPYAHYAGREALADHLKRKHGDIAHAEFTNNLFVYEARFNLLKPDTKVSIILPMKDKYKLTENCIKSILSLSTYSNYEILIVNNKSEEKATYQWFECIQEVDQRIQVINADFEFNWSKINNYAVRKSQGDVLVFLNNDTVIITPDWIERLCELTLRDDVGIVGPLLLYEDNTIQHAGVVVGIGGWADHIYKGMPPVHMGTPYVSPMVNRNVLGVTGACMCISRDKFDKLGGFDEEFIICGSDIELGIRAYEAGYNNIYNAHVRLYHLESKSRDSYIPEIDFKKSYECYGPYREDGDPYFNGNLDINNVQPRESGFLMDINKIKRHLRYNRFTAPLYKKVRDIILDNPVNYDIPEVLEIGYRQADRQNEDLRLNILVPSVNKEHVFGGILTALKFHEMLGDKLKCDTRIITTDSSYDTKNAIDLPGYMVCEPDKDLAHNKILVPFGDRYNKTIPIRKKDVFIATGWWTAYNIAEIIRWQNKTLNANNALIYFIQDYEPGFYPWSSRYLMADSTYKLDIPTIAIFNSKLLKEHFNKNNYKFSKEYYFEPTLNETLYKYLIENKDKYKRKNRILIYGRPSVQRNAFELIINSLLRWSIEFEKAIEWEIISLGEAFKDIELSNNVKVKSLGKVTLEEYARIMLETKVGISLMVSPHPSYPPLEMSTFGIKTITNHYEHKDLAEFNDNIISLSECSQRNIVSKLVELCSDERIKYVPSLIDKGYLSRNDFEKICDDLIR